MKLFDYLKRMTSEKGDWDSKDETFGKGYDKYMINRFISMVELFVPLVNEVNKYPDMPKKAHYEYFLNLLPQNNIYFNYIKKPKEDMKEELQLIMRYYECSKKEAEEYIQLLDDKQIKNVVNKFKGGVVR